MAEHMTGVGRRTAIALGAALSALVLSGPIHGQESKQGLTDPTRPPAQFVNEPHSENASAWAGMPVLQSVLISPTRRIATISGRVVRIGDWIGEARVVGIAPGQVVLRNGKEVRILKLYPDIAQLPATQKLTGNRQSRDIKGK